MKKEIVIDGNNFKTLAEFYDEIENKLTKGLDWRIGRNLDAFNDLLKGGFGIHDYEERITLVWKHSEKSKKDLGPMLFDLIIETIEGQQHIEYMIE